MADLQLSVLVSNAAAAGARQPAPAPQAPVRTVSKAPAPVPAAPVELPELPSPDLQSAQEAIDGAVEQVRQYLKDTPVGFEFSRDSGTGRMLLRIMDRETKEVIRQVPSEEILAIARALDRFKGLLTPHEV